MMVNFNYISEQLKVLGHPVRLRIVIGLLNNECCVTKITEGLGINQSTVSHHLAILKGMGIVEGKRNGTQVCYYLKDGRIKKMVNHYWRSR